MLKVKWIFILFWKVLGRILSCVSTVLAFLLGSMKNVYMYLETPEAIGVTVLKWMYKNLDLWDYCKSEKKLVGCHTENQELS